MRFGVLGETRVRTDDDRPVRVPELKVRALLASLLVDAGRPVAAHRLIDDLWGEEPPGDPLRALRAKVSQLRRALEDAEPGGRALVVSRAPGYLLDVSGSGLDAREFLDLAERARGTADPRARAGLLDAALELWRGPAFADFAEEAFTRAAANRLEEERLVVREEIAEARLAAGDHARLAGEMAELADRHPLRERLRSVQFRALYRAGRQSEALAGYEDLRTRLAEDLGLDPSPELVALHGAMLRQDPELAAPGGTEAVAVAAATASAPGTGVPAPGPAAPVPGTGNLPVSLGGIVGRAGAVAEVRELLGTRRLVTLTGPGGVGKTRLAVEAARQVRGSFPDGKWLVELAGVRGDLAEVVAAATGLRDDGVWGVLPEEERRLGSAERLAGVLRGKRMLLVLDNCEHVIDEAAVLTELLLRTAPGLVVLTTSQEALALAGETLWPVPPLAPGDAAELFAARAAAAAPGFVLDGTTADAVAGICRRLDGIPLALELAATRVRALGVHRLLERLDDRFRLLGAGRRGVPARQQTLRAVIDWSWELLSEPERTVLRRLAVHAEGCTPEAAEEVCAGGDVAAEDVLDLLVRLVDRSLVSVAETGGGPRYRLLESVAAYCQERLRDAGRDETQAVRTRHLAYYTGLAETAEPALRGPRQKEWLERLDTENANLRRALDGALTEGEGEYALRLVDALAWYWILRGRLGEARRSTEAALAAPGAGPERRARVTTWHVGITVLTGDGEDRAGRIERALGAYAADDAAGRTWARWFLAHALSGTGDPSEGEALTALALEGFRALGDRWGEAAALSDRSVQRLLKGDPAGAEADGARGAELFGEAGDACGRLWSVYPLAAVAEIRGDYDRAVRLQREGLATAREFGLSTRAADLLSGLGRLALLTGDPERARAYHGRSRAEAARLGFRAGEVNAILGLGLGARREGLLDEAEERLREVLDWHRKVGLDGANALVLAELGFVAELRGDAEGARERHEKGYATALTTGDPRAVALALEGLAGAHALAGRAEGAAVLLGAAAALRTATGAPLPPAERRDVARVEATARKALGPDAFATAFARGGTLPPEAAVGTIPAHGR
ncbi:MULTISPECIES: BTAD domain-containing putative transcriptional regulator [unclassified Streptomyces]|uniref:BTAD domain-containing putative transcriptional regulator n=1 Tax=unclassified Streptomyces TaxID=2593676 RepID=UPI0006AEAD14|nr:MULTISPECIES: BTAD domain-containing putative transcriptional regulator [unclassified Streptomyces]KOX30818.1 ATPase [Streptomyces sp. NRRL F-6491]KOX38852.1 ATPase [Streptomyces sp. NRRL F-6492]